MGAGDVSVRLPKVYRVSPNDGTVSGGVTIEDGAMKFNGVDGYVNTGLDTIRFNSSQPFTISFWVNNITEESVSRGLLGRWNAIDGQRDFGFSKLSSPDVLSFVISEDGTTATLKWVNGDKISDGNLYHIVGVYNGTHILLYQNNVLKGSKAVASVNSGSTLNLFIGRFLGATNSYSLGRFYSTQIFNRALSPSEISQIYNAGKDAYSPVTNGLVAQYSGRDYKGTALAPTRIYDTKNIGKGNDNSFIDTAFSEMRVNANSKFLLASGHKGQVYVVHIEEAA